jgi:lipopolysaccharide transport system ATP-binding protein
MNAAIKVEGLGKKYTISHEEPERYTALRDVIDRKAKGLFRKDNTKGKEDFWALRDISFEIKRGESTGIIGRNGAGKSTLLKILSRITEPSAGRAEIEGRVASLLEVGTGFHPELTGRENIFLNGAILGMSREEVKKKFDAIVDFSGVERFLDTPVKRYSSGMYLRLAFAVAAHLEPEILIVDEVLAVGDAEFQKKCLGKMDEVSRKEGRTVLFVSHNLTAIKSLCTRAIHLNEGRINRIGSVHDVVDEYEQTSSLSSERFFDESGNLFGNDLIRFHSIKVRGDVQNGAFMIDKPLSITIELTNYKIETEININVFFNNPDGTNIFATCSVPEIFEKKRRTMTCEIPANFLNDNFYGIDLMAVTESKGVLHLRNVLNLKGIEPPRKEGWMDKFPGVIRPVFKWTKGV